MSRKAAQNLRPRILLGKAKSTLYQYKRVLKRTKKPTREEFIDVVKISAAGMALIGLIGFVIQVIFINIIQI
jgi:protein transport protein SEC61 subunit gamma-like protein